MQLVQQRTSSLRLNDIGHESSTLRITCTYHLYLFAHALIACASEKAPAAMASNFAEKNCPLCSFQAPSMRVVLSHLRLVHSSDPRFNVMCGIDGCSSTFRTFSAFYSHIYRRHKNSGIIKRETGAQVSDTNTSGTFQPADEPSNLFQYDPHADMGK